MDERPPEWTRGRRKRQPSSAPVVLHGLVSGSRHVHGLRDGFAVGTIVFAPKRHRTKLLHYALAEITGIQACAGTATVAFVKAEPGVDDEAVPLYTLVPCPHSVLGVGIDQGGDAEICSLVGHVLRARAEVGTMECGAPQKWLSCPSDSSSEASSVPASPTGNSPLPGFAPTLLEVVRGVDEVENEGSGSWSSLHVSHAASESDEVFYARAFSAVYCAIRRRLQNPLKEEEEMRQRQVVVLCVFEAYATLHRFDLYMALRGHRVHLVDGVRCRSACSAVDNRLCFHGAQLSALDALWLCLLAEDIEDERTTMDLLKGWLPLRRQGERQHGDSSGVDNNGSHDEPISLAVVQFGGRNEHNADVDADAAVGRLLAVVRRAAAVMIKCQLSCDAGGGDLMTTSLTAVHRSVVPLGKEPQQGNGVVLELCVPASTWQLKLIHFLVAQSPNSAEKLQLQLRRRCPSLPREDEPPLCGDVPMSPALLQAIANGNVFDDSLSVALASSPGGMRVMGALRGRVMRGGRFFGEEAFPVFAAVRAVLEDVLSEAPSSGSRPFSRKRRVALVLSSASGTATDATAYQHAVRQFLHPWRTFALAVDERQRPSVAALLDSLSWLETGGVMLLSPEDPLCKLSALREEAEVIITCGKAAAAAAHARAGVTHVALHSEVELVDGIANRRSWTPWLGPNAEEGATDFEQTVVKRVVVGSGGSERKGARTEASPVLETAAALLQQQLGGGATEEQGGRPRKRRRADDTGWSNLARFAEGVLFGCCRAAGATSEDGAP